MNTALVTIGILVALIAGFFAGRWHGMSQRSKQLSEELEQKEEELKDLKSNVNEHFSETARLFTNLTEEYKNLYQHLAKGATKLSDESFKLALGAPAAEVLNQQDSANPTTEEASTNDDITEVAAEDLVESEVVQPVDYAHPTDQQDETSENSEQESSSDKSADSEQLPDPSEQDGQSQDDKNVSS